MSISDSPAPTPFPDPQVWLTVRVRCTDQNAAEVALVAILDELELVGKPIDQDNLMFDLMAGNRTFRYRCGSARIGAPGGGEFDGADL